MLLSMQRQWYHKIVSDILQYVAIDTTHADHIIVVGLYS